MTRIPQRRRPRRALAGTTSVLLGFAVLTALPLSGHATAVQIVDKLTGPVGQVVGGTPQIRVLDQAAKERERLERLRSQAAQPQQQDPKTDPALMGANPHGQGTVAVLDVNPSTDRPQDGDPAGSETDEEVVAGRARGEQRDDGTYHGHITILALFGNEVLGVDTAPGQTDHGPLNAVQEGLLTPLCDGSGNQVCLSVLTADSTTTDSGSQNHFSAAHVTLGGSNGIDAGAAESNGNISDDGTCQTARGDSSVASAKAGGQAVADVAQSSSTSTACKKQAPTQTNESKVIALGGTGVPLPAAGCANGTPDVVTGIPTLAPVVCNADDTNGAQAEHPYGVREALSVFVLEVGGVQLLKAGTSGSQSRAKAPLPQCSDRRDNDGDGKVDLSDPGCDGPNDDDETDDRKPQCSDTADNDGDGKIDARDPGCHSDGDPDNPATYDPRDDDETDGPGRETSRPDGGRPECSDRRDNDGDERIDADDPGCLSGPGGSYDPNDDSEEDVESLPFTGSDALMLGIAGLFLLGAGLDLRRRLAPGAVG